MTSVPPGPSGPPGPGGRNADRGSSNSSNGGGGDGGGVAGIGDVGATASTSQAHASTSSNVIVPVLSHSPSHVDDNGIDLTWKDLRYSITTTAKAGAKGVVPNSSATTTSGTTTPAQKKSIKTVQLELLKGVSGEARSGEVIAILGASGAGKTTLLNVLAGRISDQGSLSGSVLVNNKPRHKDTWKKVVAYVEQDDLMFRQLSVRETLEFAALLRLPRSISRQQKLARVEQIILQLGLTKCSDTRVGDPEKRGISGGERKRLSIGIELVSDPKLLFLDEPTSGLDSFTAITIIDTIKNIAKAGNKTILMTIHQPRAEILAKFDKFYLMAQGKVIYFGTLQGAIAHFEKCGYPLPPLTNPSDFFLDMITNDFRSPEQLAVSLERIKTLHDTWDRTGPTIAARPVPSNPSENPDAYGNPFFTEIGYVLARNLKEVFRDPGSFGASIGQSIVLVVIVGFVYYQSPLNVSGIQNRIGALFLITINLTFGNVSPIIESFTYQRAIIKRERAANTYRVSSAFLAKVLSALILPFVSATLLALPVYWMVGMQNDYLKYITFLAFIWIHAIIATLLGIAIGSGVPNAKTGQILAPLIIVVFLLFGGQLVSLSAIPSALQWLKWISIIHYTYQGLAINEFSGLKFSCSSAYGCYSNGQQVLDAFALNDLDLYLNMVVNAGIGVAFLLIGFFLFQWRSKPMLRLT